jgi:hypothetical protein
LATCVRGSFCRREVSSSAASWIQGRRDLYSAIVEDEGYRALGGAPSGSRFRSLLAPTQALPAAVHGQSVAVDKGALLGVCEERDRLRDVLWSGEAAHRDAALYVLVGVAAAGLILDVHLGLGVPKYPSFASVPYLPRAEYASSESSFR